tara:strand:+ start:115 stop:333 length:219 start_codon:yes stop_codon:yes gene_type:complete
MASPEEPVLGRPDLVPSTRLDTFPVEGRARGMLDPVHFRSSEITAVCPVSVVLAQQISGGIVTIVTATGEPS